MSVVHEASPVDPLGAAEAAPHTWRLSGVEFEDGVTVRCFECISCGAARYS